MAIARSYLRVSDKSTALGHEEASPDEQDAVNQRDAEARGWTRGDSYRDIGSASRYARKARQGFDALIADLENDRFGADILMLWESSRGSRQVSEWVTLIDLCEQRRVRIYVTTHNRTYDPAVARDRRSLQEDAVDSEYESAKTSDRLLRNHVARAAEGRPAGHPPYGYRSEYDPSTGRLLGRVPEPTEAAHVLELFQRVAAGESVYGITRDFAKRGIEKRSGGPFAMAHLRTFLRRRCYVGERTHTARRSGVATVTPGQWEPIVDRKTWVAVQEILSDPKRRTSRPGGAKHLLSMAARCDRCGSKISVRVRTGIEAYQCRDKGCILIGKEALDEFAEQVIVAYISSRDVYKPKVDRSDKALAVVDDQLAEARAELAELKQRSAALELSVAFAASVEPALLARVEKLERRRDTLSQPSFLRGLVPPGQDVAEWWAALTDIAVRRRIVSVVLSPEHAGELRVTPCKVRGRREPVESRVVFRRGERGGSAQAPS